MEESSFTETFSDYMILATANHTELHCGIVIFERVEDNNFRCLPACRIFSHHSALPVAWRGNQSSLDVPAPANNQLRLYGSILQSSRLNAEQKHLGVPSGRDLELHVSFPPSCAWPQ